MTLTVGSLFSGIGGLDLGLERAGMKVIWQSEIDPFACRVLSKHWPEVVNHGNIKEINWDSVERPDVICGGYPCQPFSTAGKRRGEEDPRHLWPWVRESISRLRPRYAILENVRGHLTLGGLSVVGDLAALGYDCEWRVVSAASVGANHRRDRVIIVAYAHGSHSPDGRQCEAVPGKSGDGRDDRGRGQGDSRQVGVGGTRQNSENVADTDNTGSQRRHSSTHPERQTTNGHIGPCCPNVAHTDGAPGQHQHDGQVQEPDIGRCGADVADTYDARNGTPRRCDNTQRPQVEPRREVYSFAEPGRFRGIPDWWETEPDVGRVADGIPNRVDRLRGLGNAVVPQVAEVIGRMVIAHAQTV